jgi:hypothetical protein
VLAVSPDGCSEAIAASQMVELVQAGPRDRNRRAVAAGERTMEVARVRITAAGRQGVGRLIKTGAELGRFAVPRIGGYRGNRGGCRVDNLPESI